MREQPSAGLGPVAVHPTHSGVGPRSLSYFLSFPVSPNILRSLGVSLYFALISPANFLRRLVIFSHSVCSILACKPFGLLT